MPYPNQPNDVSDQAFRVASNLTMLVSRGGTLGDSINIARILDREYGRVPDQNLLVQIDLLKASLDKLRAEVQTQISLYQPVKSRPDSEGQATVEQHAWGEE